MISKLIFQAGVMSLLMAFGANAGQDSSHETPERYQGTGWTVSEINGVAPSADLAIIISFEDDYILIDQGCYSFLAWPQKNGVMKVQLIEPFVACQMPMSDQQTAVYEIFEHAVAFIPIGPSSFRLTTKGSDNLEADELLPQILRLELPHD